VFHIARFRGDTAEALCPPSLRKILESPVIKTGVNIMGDFKRLKFYLNVQGQGISELSYLHNLIVGKRIKSGARSISLISLDKLSREYLGMVLDKSEENVRISNWSYHLNKAQTDYAANDAYAALHIFYEMERKRLEMSPSISRPVCLQTGQLVRDVEAAFALDQEEENWESDSAVSDSDSFELCGNSMALRQRTRARLARRDFRRPRMVKSRRSVHRVVADFPKDLPRLTRMMTAIDNAVFRKYKSVNGRRGFRPRKRLPKTGLNARAERFLRRSTRHAADGKVTHADVNVNQEIHEDISTQIDDGIPINLVHRTHGKPRPVVERSC